MRRPADQTRDRSAAPGAGTRRGVILGAAAMAAPAHAAPRASGRPPAAERRFTSPAVEAELIRVQGRIGDAELAWMFANTFPNTLDTTVSLADATGREDSFVVTGDIAAMWLRDSACQVAPYVRLAPRDAGLRRLLRGLIGRHARSILIDPYANAFTHDPHAKTDLPWALADDTEMRPGVAERKWEIDSLLHPMRLAVSYWRATGDLQPFDGEWTRAMTLAVATLRAQQRTHDRGPYRFERKGGSALDTLQGLGWGPPTRKVGLIHSAFRPSDDAGVYPFLIPANLFAVSALRALAPLLRAAGDGASAGEGLALAAEVDVAVRRHGLTPTAGGPVLAYEVDGFGNQVFLDEPNAPSLSSLAYLGAMPRDSPLFRRTESTAWSPRNPYFVRGRAAEGIGSSHTAPERIWPMSIIMHALASDDDREIAKCLRMLKASHAGTGFIHEAFDKDDPGRFSRPWFAWANSLFAELIVDLAARKPHLLA